ncbi:MAG: glutamate racemase [Roseburia sp.]|nr:glutamate racemase [Roseburia sp.]
MERYSTPQRDSVVVFDSGIGGLNLLYACAKRVPQAEYIYIADSAHVPYGNRPPEEIMRLTLAALGGIERFNPRALVVACNTVTANCIGRLRQIFPFPVIGIQPAVKPAAKAGGRCLVLATRATVNSPSFLKLTEMYAPESATVVGCEGLAEYIESNVLNLPPVLPDGLLPDVTADGVVLGCTHYTFVKKQIAERYNCPVYDGTEGTAARFCEIVGMSDHFQPRKGIFDRLPLNKLKITFLTEKSEYYSQIMKCLFSI